MPPPTQPSTPPPTPPDNSLSDIFSSTSLSSSPSHPTEHHSTHPSDIPRLRSTHSTAGYREGIASSKSSSVQPGFDEGYSLGAVLGLRVGYILGVLEGLVHATSEKERGTEILEGKGESAAHAIGDRMRMMLEEAREALRLEKIFGKEWFGVDGVWTFEIGKRDGKVTFVDVADSHPVVREWAERVGEEMKRFGIVEGRFEGKEWEEGRVGHG